MNRLVHLCCGDISFVFSVSRSPGFGFGFGFVGEPYCDPYYLFTEPEVNNCFCIIFKEECEELEEI